jgi:L-cystine uptake protein TcyP (sodium:dicarboxylate symporter family)
MRGRLRRGREGVGVMKRIIGLLVLIVVWAIVMWALKRIMGIDNSLSISILTGISLGFGIFLGWLSVPLLWRG